MLESGDCLNRFCSAPVVSTVRLMRFMQLARSTLKTPKAADGPRDKTGQMPAHSPALLLLVARRDRYASWSCTSSSHPHAHLHAQLGRICIRRPIGGCHRSIVIGARPHALEELVARRCCCHPPAWDEAIGARTRIAGVSTGPQAELTLTQDYTHCARPCLCCLCS